MTEEEPRLRSDAQRNRDDLLDAAVVALSKDANASLDGIARAAGVGIGTLYRHFPTREALFEAAYRNEIAKLCDGVPELLERHAPDEALALFLGRFIEHMEKKRGMVQAMLAAVGGNRAPLNDSLTMVRAAVTPLIEAGRAQGVLRDDVTIDDFLLIKGAVAFAGPARARRLVEIVLDGLRARAPMKKTTRTKTAKKKKKAKTAKEKAKKAT